MEIKNKHEIKKKSSRSNPDNIRNKIKALISVYKLYGTPIKIVSEEIFTEIFNDPKLSK